MDATVKTHDTGVPVPAEPPATGGPQPFLHDKVLALAAPSLVVSAADGQLGAGADGFYHGDRRALARLTVAVGGSTLAPVHGGPRGADGADFRAVLRGLGEETADPAVALHRRRTVAPGRLTETLEVTNAGGRHVRFRLTVTAGTDLAAMDRVKSGDAPAPVPARTAADSGATALTWTDGDFTARLTPHHTPDGMRVAAGELSYEIALAPGASWSTTLTCAASHTDGDLFPAPPAGGPPWSTAVLRGADRRFDAWLEQSLADLDRLRLADPRSPDPARPDQFLAAGAPWYFTLFGRDSLWAARMLLPLGTDLAAGTLRVLARRQGTATDPATEEQPGKILHEVRRGGLRLGDRLSLPPVYFGTVDATPLWVVLLHDAWRWGLSPAETEELLPHAEAALGWMRDRCEDSPDGFLRYVDGTGLGLSHQGWKDSDDAVRHHDGRRARPPIALCEVQAYAHEAALGGAALLRAFGRPGADAWEEWAERLAGRFRARFWVEDERGPYPALALDGDGSPVRSVTSGFGHLLGTGLLNGAEEALLAERLARPDLDAGHGLRTLSSEAAGYNPYGYHVGAIWPHDTAIAVHGLVRAGFPDTAARLTEGLLTASAGFGARLPELFAGHGAAQSRHPAAYPASCRPQAWAAAAAVLVLQSALGLTADVPAGTLTVASAPPDFAPLEVTGLRAGGEPLAVSVAADGTVTVRGPEGLRVEKR